MLSFRAAMKAIRASFTCLGIFAMLQLTPAGAEEKPSRVSQPSLIVTPSSSMAFSGPRGGPFSPARFEFRVSSTTGIVSYSIRTPSWLTASSTFGTADTRGVTITLTVNANASRLLPGAYGPGVAFTNVELKRFDEALLSFERALTVQPDYADAHWNEAILRL